MGQAEADTAQSTVESLRARIALARQQVQVAESLVSSQETDLRDMIVRAPFDGVAISKDAQPGEMISPVSAGGGFTRTGICTMVDMSSLEIEVDVAENYINRVKPEQPVEAVLDAYADWRIPASVITTVPTADRQKATVMARLEDRRRIEGETRSTNPAGHGRQGVVPQRATGGGAGCAGEAAPVHRRNRRCARMAARASCSSCGRSGSSGAR